MIALKILLLCIGFALLMKGADWFVDGCAGIANRFGIPQIVIGLTIVAMGTSAPEAAVSITAALKGNVGISVGNVIGSNISVDAATAIAKQIGISNRIIGLTIVALGTSLPELVTSIIAARKGNDDIAIGNIVGSNIFNILFVIGTSSIIIPIKFQNPFIVDGMVAVLAGISLFLLTMKRKKLNRIGGMILLCEYAVYSVYLFNNN